VRVSSSLRELSLGSSNTFLEKAGVAHKVDFREDPALERLDELLADERSVGAFDIAFVDADKPNYARYHEQLLRLVRVGSAIVYDNTLWVTICRRVVRSSASVPMVSVAHDIGSLLAPPSSRSSTPTADPSNRPRGEIEEERAMAAGGDTIAQVHSGIDSSNKTLLKSEALYKYVLDTSVLPHEPECMRELRLVTDKHEWGFMQSSPDEAQLLRMLIKLTGARNTLEVGVFTGYSLLATALALPEDGKVIAIDVDRDYYEIGRPFIEKAGVAHKVDFREGPALEHLDAILADEANVGAFDFAFVDADKPNYVRYHEQLLKLVRVGGTIVYDNTLWAGTVALPPDTPLSDLDRRFSAAIKDLNVRLSADGRVEVCQLAIADGVTICRRLV
ncbi:Tricin synthase 1, partial [Dichanthelium oligosanthes]